MTDAELVDLLADVLAMEAAALATMGTIAPTIGAFEGDDLLGAVVARDFQPEDAKAVWSEMASLGAACAADTMASCCDGFLASSEGEVRLDMDPEAIPALIGHAVSYATPAPSVLSMWIPYQRLDDGGVTIRADAGGLQGPEPVGVFGQHGMVVQLLTSAIMLGGQAEFREHRAYGALVCAERLAAAGHLVTLALDSG